LSSNKPSSLIIYLSSLFHYLPFCLMLFFGIIGYHNISYVGNVHMHRIPASDPIFIFLIVFKVESVALFCSSSYSVPVIR
jgi:hypothetical protein